MIGQPRNRSGIARLLALAMLVPAPAVAQDGTDAAADASVAAVDSPAPVTVGPADGEELARFKDAQGRFSSRMSELEQDTREYLDQRESAEKKKLSDGYDQVISQLDEDSRAQRQLAIERFEQFLTRYPDAPYASHVRFRLADLYWEDAKERWLADTQSYYKLEEQLTAENRVDELPEEPKIDLSRVIDLYTTIIADNEGLPADQRYEHLDGAYYSLAYTYMEENASQYDDSREMPRAAFQKLLTVTPDSQFADIAHLNLGNFLFEENKVDDAIAEYQLVFDKGPEGSYYPDAMYKLAWSYYKKAHEPPEFDPALALFVKLLDYSDQLYKDSGKKSDYAPDAIKYTAFSFADIAQIRQDAGMPGGNAEKVAEAYFEKNGHREYEWDVYVALGDMLTEYGRFPEAIDVYKKLQTDDRWRLRPENPEFQMKIVKLLASGPTPDLAASAAARIELTEKYNDKSEWWYANRHNPEALANAYEFIQGSLADVAVEYRIKADEDKTPASYALAAQKYQEYLDTFPMSDDYYQRQWEYADTLIQAKQYGAAEKEYKSLIRSAKHHPYGDGSLVELWRAQRLMLIDKYGTFDQQPKDATVERTYTSVGKKDIQVFALEDDVKSYIDTCDALLKHKFAPVDEKQKDAIDWAKAVQDYRSVLMYEPGQILFYHNRFDEARPRLIQVVKAMPQSQEGTFAARLIVDSYTIEGDLANLRLYTKQFSMMTLGPDKGSAEANTKLFKGKLEETAFLQAQAYIDQGDREKAAEAFLSFIDEFPDSANAKAALYNAANSYEIIGKAEKANELFEQYVNKYPDDTNSAKLYFRIAANYESTFQLDKAIDYYNRLLKYAPANDPNRSAALYNASFLLIGVGQHQKAAEGFEKYSHDFANEADAEQVHFMAGEQWEQVSPQKAIAFYENVDQWSDDPNHILTADYKIAQMYKAKGDTKDYNKFLDKVLADWNKYAPTKAADIKSDPRHYAAEAAFRDVEAEFAKLTDVKKPYGDDKKDKELFANKEAAVAAFRDKAVATETPFGDFDYITGALYYQAMAKMYYADLGFAVQVPTSVNGHRLTDEEKDLFQQVLDEKWYPQYTALQDSAKGELEKLIQLGKDQKQHSEWIDKAYTELNELDPFTYPAVKNELRGGADSTILPTVQPKEMAPPEAAPPTAPDFGTPPDQPAPGGQPAPGTAPGKENP